jgi:uncharacterized RDD family membrane protein YckC
MAKWRDVKQNKVQKNSKKEKLLIEEINPCATLPSRLKAFLTDSFLITTPIVYIVIYLIMGSGDGFAQNRVVGWALIVGVHCAIILLFWYIKGQTPGLKAYSLKLTRTQDDKRVTFNQTVIRYYATLFAIMSFFLLFIPFFNKQKKTFQDLVSNTIIIDDK